MKSEKNLKDNLIPRKRNVERRVEYKSLLSRYFLKYKNIKMGPSNRSIITIRMLHQIFMFTTQVKYAAGKITLTSIHLFTPSPPLLLDEPTDQ